MNQGIFLDRDGVINEVIIKKGIPHPPQEVHQVKIIAGVRESIKKFKLNGIQIVIVTNQPDVGRGTLAKETVEEINGYLKAELHIEHVYCCYHDNLDNCGCRKPSPGMLIEAAQNLNLDLSRSYMVGDRWRDIEAGQAAGCTSFFIDYGYAEKLPNMPFIRVTSLLDAAQKILGESK
jgi:D-glycero-D-manno-heptose 1,7-bisphosphate phosphatase